MKNKFGLFGVMFGTLLLSAVLVSSCNKDDDDGGNDGKIDPGTIATSNLIAYFPLEEEGEDPEGSALLTFNQAVGDVSFPLGRRGNGYQGAATESYLEYDIASGTSLKTLDEVTVSCWIKTHHPLGGAAKILTINGGDLTTMGGMALLQESAAAGDSVDIKFYIYDSESPDWKGQDIRIQSSKFTSDIWFHLVALYNKTSSSLELYSNGVLVGTSIRYAGPDPGEGDQPLLGPIKLGQDMTKLHIGAWTQQIAGNPQEWMKYYPGLVDEIRIFNKALSAEEIKDLYEAEVTQIN